MWADPSNMTVAAIPKERQT